VFWITGVLCTLSMFCKGSPSDAEVRAEERAELSLPEHVTSPQRFCSPCCRRGSEPFDLESRNYMGGICFSSRLCCTLFSLFPTPSLDFCTKHSTGVNRL